ncbi:MAG TPA: hypothetical protein PKH79_01605 [Prolixibacteraceae bacterium]|nr:hypothetical protein [Prolixibacteraceae bacterium]
MKNIAKSMMSLIVFSFIVTMVFVSCSSKEDTAPGLTIYKTKADYIDKVYIRIFPDSSLRSYSTYGQVGRRETIIDPTDSSFLGRIQLGNGYVYAEDFLFCDEGAFLSLSIKEYIRLQDKSNSVFVSDTFDLTQYIIDADPFIEFYRDENRPRKYELTDTAIINEIIRNGELEKYFVRVK